MSKESNLLVTFSKRRSGLFKKASELCTLCGVEIAIVVFSPGHKVFSFGHPNVDSIVNRFLTRNPTSSSSTTCQLVEAHRNANVRELNTQLTEILNQLEFEKKREVEIEKIQKGKIGKNWWESPLNELEHGELEQLKLGMEELKKNVTKQMQKIIFEASNTPTFFLGGSSSSNGDVKNIKGLGLSMATNGHTTMAKKPSMGRQKIKIAKIEVKNHLQVTFSKRRSGLFKKASELCTLCGVEIAIIVFSPARKVFSFGHPNVESIIDRFLTRNNSNNNPIANNSVQLVEAHRNASVRGLNLQLTQILGEVEIEKKRGESLDQMRKTSQSQYWWEAPISQLDLQELEQLKDSMEVLKKNVTNQANKFMVNETANPSFFGVNGNGIFDNYDIKPPRNMVASNNLHNHNLGFDSAAFF
ncbi:hypothetical protein H5410_010515 [Solanum commersonii]|uniref:MADS-box domain-containing protein n=1 Tax=Solanum commersonii TaxID=4109 RepID=A0A9J6ALM7_SOLCO|nr:hypothetical protein H5410_010515 [Solanum commersonii]